MAMVKHAPWQETDLPAVVLSDHRSRGSSLRSERHGIAFVFIYHVDQ
jgi:hypothetical protein